MLATSDRPIGINPLIFAVCSGSTPDFSNLLAIRVRSGLGTSSLRSSTTRAARRNRFCRSSSSGLVQSKSWKAEYARSTRSGETTVSGPA